MAENILKGLAILEKSRDLKHGVWVLCSREVFEYPDAARGSPYFENLKELLNLRTFDFACAMYELSPHISIFDIIMGKLSKYTAQLPFGHGKRGSLNDTEGSHSEKQKYVGPYDNTPIPRVTIHSSIMGVFVSEGGFIFGYDTSQISGFLSIHAFQNRFGQRHSDGTYYFSNVRSGLIVALLSIGTLMGVLIGGPTTYILHIDPRKGSKWIAPPPEELITTERIAGGHLAGISADLEASDSARARAKETAPGGTADYAD